MLLSMARTKKMPACALQSYHSENGTDWNSASLVPRPSPAPVFDRLQYAKTRSKTGAAGKAWERG